MMTSLFFSGAGLMALAAASTLPAENQEVPSSSATRDVIIVSGIRGANTTVMTVKPDAAPLEGADITRLTARLPGAARIGNGELSGQMSYRGLFGERLNLRVDGQRFASGGPNLMDPVFHYAPGSLIAAVVVDRGVSPVSEGPGLAGGADAIFKKVDYAQGSSPEFHYDLTLSARSINDSYSTGGVAGGATKNWRVNLLGAYEKGEDTNFPGGTIAGTEFERGVYGLSAGRKFGGGEVTLDLRHQDTGPSGNPPFPMDIRYFETDFARLGLTGDLGSLTLSAALHYTDVAHAMNNFDLRPAPPAMLMRETYAAAETVGGEVSVGGKAFAGDFEIGFDAEQAYHDVTITNPMNADFFVTPFPGITMVRAGGFAEWTGPLGPLEGELGLRIDRHRFEAGEAVTGPALPAGPQMIAGMFNARDRQGEETTFDGVIRLWTPEVNGFSWRTTLAHKTHLPGYIQRYGWLPINASGGLADGNIYVGDLDLAPEIAWIAEAGFDYSAQKAYARPTIYYRRIDDYIQGTPFDDTPGVLNTPQEMIANMNGDPTPLIWANVDAELYGADLDWGYDFEGPLRLDGVVSYVRGKRRDIDDNLYRVSPPSALAALTWEEARWSASLEARGVASQKEASFTNSEEETPGYMLLNLYADWDVAEGIGLSAGVENLLDKQYRDHLAGYNRNGFGDVHPGDRVPGAGRGVFLRLSLTR